MYYDPNSSSQYFIGVTLLAMIPEIPEIVNGVQFALQNQISLRSVCSVTPYSKLTCSRHHEITMNKIFCIIHSISGWFHLVLSTKNTCILLFSHSFEVGSCIAVQVCMIQIPILVLFNVFYVSGFRYAFQNWLTDGCMSMCFPDDLSVTGCWLCTHLQRPASVGQHL